MPDTPTKRKYTLSEIAKILGVDERQIHRLAHKGLIDPKLSNDEKARFNAIDCARLKTIKQADELGYEPEAIFRLIGQPDEVPATDDPVAACEDRAMVIYKQIYDELNHCEPLEQLNKQCDLRLLKGYIKNLKELRTGAAPDHQEQKTESPSKPSTTVMGVKASMGGPIQAPESAPSASVRPYSVAKYWEYMRKVEELQREVSADIPHDDGAPQRAVPPSADDGLDLSSLPKVSAGKSAGGPVFDDLSERSKPFQQPEGAFDKQQSWGVWILVGVFMVLIAAGYFFMSGPDEKPPKPGSPKAVTDSGQTASQASGPEVEQQLSTEVVSPGASGAQTLQAEDERANAPGSEVGLEVADLNLWHDSLNKIYRADFTIAKSQKAKNQESVSGYAFVYLGFEDGASEPKSLLLPSGEMQTSKPTQIRRGARFSIKNFKKMRIASASDLPPGDIVSSNILVYSPEGELLLEKSFDVSIQPLLSTSEPSTVPWEVRDETAKAPEPIEPIVPEPPPVVLPRTPTPKLKDTKIARKAVDETVPPPEKTPTELATKAPPAAATRPDPGIKEKKLADARPDSGVKRTLQDSRKTRRTSDIVPSTVKIQKTGNPEAATWEQRSYNAAVRGNFEQAIADATKAVELDPGRINPYINRSWAYLQKDMLDEAIRDCKTALLIDPKNAFAYNNRGLVYLRKGRTAMAKKDYRRACDLGLELGCRNFDALADETRVAELIKQSQAAFKAKKWDDVIRATSEVIKIDPLNAVAYTNRSAAYAQKNFLNKALKDSNEAIVHNPDFALAYNNRGYVFELLGNNRKAAADYLKSCSLGSDLGCNNYDRLNRTP